MNLAPQELERNASKSASDAIKYDSQGARGMAISHYEKAIQSLSKLMRLYPDSKPVSYTHLTLPTICSV